jgi:MraZ protein
VDFSGNLRSQVESIPLFRGNSPARIDEKGRLKVPQAFRSALESKYGRELFLTSLTGEYVRIYPMPVWIAIEQKLAGVASTLPARLRFLDRVNYFGQAAELDPQGRVIIPVRLRDAATMSGDVDVLGQVDYLDVWNHDRFLTKMQREPFTDEDARALAQHGI